MPKRKLISADEASVGARQPTEPCSDCPFARDALAGWLGTMSADDWVRAAHGESVIDCHAIVAEGGTAFQCAGAAIYRANVGKRCWPQTGALELPRNTATVFASPAEFRAHHEEAED